MISLLDFGTWTTPTTFIKGIMWGAVVSQFKPHISWYHTFVLCIPIEKAVCGSWTILYVRPLYRLIFCNSKSFVPVSSIPWLHIHRVTCQGCAKTVLGDITVIYQYYLFICFCNFVIMRLVLTQIFKNQNNHL